MTQCCCFVEWTDSPVYCPETGLHLCSGHPDPCHRGLRDPPIHRGQDQTHVSRDYAGKPHLRLGWWRRSVFFETSSSSSYLLLLCIIAIIIKIYRVCIFRNWQHYSKLDKHEKNMDTCHNQYLFFSFAWLHCFCFLFIILIYRWITHTIRIHWWYSMKQLHIYTVVNDTISVFHINC